jgi:hypothetical protein
MLWLVKFFEGGLQYDSVMKMSLPELKILLEQADGIVRAHKDG